MNQKATRYRALFPIVIAWIVDFVFFFLLLQCGLPVWIAALGAWVGSICAGFGTDWAQNKRFPCEVDAFLTELIYCGLSGSLSLLTDLLIMWGGSILLTQLGLWLKPIAAIPSALVFWLSAAHLQKSMQKLRPILNCQTVSYLFFGVMTTLVNIVIHWGLSERLSVMPMLSNTVAWVGAVLFAYVTNRKYVFKSHTTKAAFRKEILLFFVARLLSLGVDSAGMALCLYVFHWDNMLSKVLLNGVVIVLNYFASKWMIFSKTQKE